MPKLSLEFAVDFGSLTKELEKAEQKSKDAFSKIGEGSAVGQVSSAFRDIAEQVEAMSEASDKFNKSWGEGLKADKARLDIAKEILKTQRSMSDLERHERQAQAAQGRGGGGGGGYGVGGYRGGRGYRRGALGGMAAGAWAGGMNLAGQASEGMVTTTDYLQLGGSAASMAGRGMMGVALFKQMAMKAGGKVLGPIGLALEATAQTLQFAAKMTGRDDKNRARAMGVFAASGEVGSNLFMRALANETGYGASDQGFGVYKYGLNQDELVKLTGGLGKVAPSMLAEKGGLGTKSMRELASMKRMYGAEEQALGLAGAMERGGGFTGKTGERDRMELFGLAAGVAIAQELDHGRFGEAHQQMSAVAANLESRGNLDARMIASLVASIGQMGDRYKGTGPGAMQAFNVQEGISGSQTSYGEYRAFQRIQEREPGVGIQTMRHIRAIAGTKEAKFDDLKAAIDQVRPEALNLVAGGMDPRGVTTHIRDRYGIPKDKAQATYDLLFKGTDVDASGFAKDAEEVLGAKPKELWVKGLRKQAAAWTLSSLTKGKGGGPEHIKARVERRIRELKAKAAGEDVSMPDYLSESTNVNPLGAAIRKNKQKEWLEANLSPFLQRLTGGAGEEALSMRERNEAYLKANMPKGAGGTGYFNAPRPTTPDSEGVYHPKKRKHKSEDVPPSDTRNTPIVPVAGELTGFGKQGAIGWHVTIKVTGKNFTSYTMHHLLKPFKWVRQSKGKFLAKGTAIAPGLWPLRGYKHVDLKTKKDGVEVDSRDLIDYADVTGPSGIGRPEDVSPGAASVTDVGADAGLTGEAPGVPAGGVSSPGAGGGGVGSVASPGASGGVQVALTITDRTSGGVSISHTAQGHAQNARKPAPGDIPALNR